MKSSTVAVIIPALNEAGNITRLVAETLAVPDLMQRYQLQIIVVDNGSTDDTAAEAQAAGAQVVSEPRQGYGYACAAGVAASTSAMLVFMDGDGSFDPAEMVALIQPIAEGEADMVVGSRAAYAQPGTMPPHQRFGNQLVAWLMGRFYGLHVTDLGPYRAIRRDHLLRLNMREMTFGWPQEMMVKAARCGLRIQEVPVQHRKRWSGKSKVSGTLRGTLLATYFILGITLRYAFTPNQAGSEASKR